MQTNQRLVEQFMKGIPDQAETMPPTPNIPEFTIRRLRAKLMLEETLETIHAMGIHVHMMSMRESLLEIENLAFVESREKPDLIEIADGLADQEVVMLGTALVHGVDMVPIFEAVMTNNMLKLENPRFDSMGKLIKPHGHPRPDIEKVLREQGWKP